MVKKKKTKKEILEYRRIQGKKYYHSHKDEINRKRKKERGTKIKKRSISRRKKRSTLPRSNSSLKIGASGRLKIHCPIHKHQTLHRLVYNTAVKKNPSGKNRRGLVGTKGLTDCFYCEKCGKPYSLEMQIVLIA